MLIGKYSARFAFLLLILSAIPSFAQWTQQTTNVSDYLYDIKFWDESYGFASGWGASSGGVILKTTDGGLHWFTTIPLANAYLFGITFRDSLNVLISGYDPRYGCAMILKSDNAGETWSIQDYTGSFGFYNTEFPTLNTGYACGYQGVIVKTTDGGTSWSPTNTGTTEVFRWMHFPSEQVGYAVSGTSFSNPRKVWRTTNGGSNWSMVRNMTNSVIGGIHFQNDSTGVAVGNSSTEKVWKSFDFGSNWMTMHNTEFAGVLQDVCFNGEWEGWSVGDGGRIHRTNDGGDSWELDTVISAENVFLAVSAKGNAVYASGSNGSIFKRMLTSSTKPKQSSVIPLGMRLQPCFPNPFNNTTTIKFSLPHLEKVTIIVYDVSGRRIETLFSGRSVVTENTLKWRSDQLPSGQYFVQMVGEQTRLIQPVSLVR